MLVSATILLLEVPLIFSLLDEAVCQMSITLIDFCDFTSGKNGCNSTSNPMQMKPRLQREGELNDTACDKC